MLSFDFAFNAQSKDFGQSERGPDVKAGACQREVVDGARKLLPRWAEFYDPTPVRGGTRIFSAVTIGHHSDSLAQAC